MQKNETLTLRVEEINNLGFGVGHLTEPDGTRGRVVFVRGAVTGDLVEASVIKVNKSYLVARLLRVIERSPFRSEYDLCNASEGCGGCVYRHVTYEHEKDLKREYIQNAFRKAGLPDVRVEPVRSTEVLSGYRNKAQYPVENSKNGMRAGFFAVGTHRLVPAEDCRLQPPEFAAVVAWICKFCDRHGVRAYDEESGKGLLRHIYLRRGQNTGEMMVCLVLNGEKFPEETAFAESLTRAFPEVVSVLVNVNREKTNVVLGEHYRLLWGREEIEDELCGLRFRLAPGAFYQVNHDACELLYGLAAEKAALTPDDRLVDLYCGIGTIGLSVASKVKKIVGIEIVPEAVERAKENAARNGISNAFFSCGDASDAEKLLADAEAEHGTLDGAVVVMDPPRKGSTPELIRYLASRDFCRIVYVSCNPDTLARDCALFADLGYSVGTVTPVDLFPRTGHVETVCLLSNKA